MFYKLPDGDPSKKRQNALKDNHSAVRRIKKPPSLKRY
jgi:hypothetical protein